MIVIIPARGGSKRIPRKNIRDFNGQPILAQTIFQIQETELFERIFVSTEDNEIASVAKSAGAEVVMRHPELADDFTTTVDVIAATILQLESTLGVESEIYCCVYPITPRLPRHYLVQGLNLLKSENLDYVFSAKQYASSPGRSLVVGADGKSEMQYPEFLNTRTQDLPKSFHDAALFYLGRRESWLEKKPVLFGNTKFIEVGKYDSVDVDDEIDWQFMIDLHRLRNSK